MMGHFLSFISNSHFRRIALPACLVWGAMGAAVACGSSDQPVNTGVLAPRTKPATQTVTVTVEFPTDDSVKGTTNSLHVWFIEGDDAGANCADLVGGATDPNAGPVGHLGDVVTKEVDGPITAKGVGVGSPTLVYVEAVDDNGQVEWAGCAEANKGKVTVTLSKARVYKCDEPDVKNGAPCDDGDPCTVGESCRDGECKSGKQRDCSDLDTDCSVGQCDPDLGCIKVPYNDGATCDDGLYCTTEDTCVNGDCIGTAKNCDTNSGGCRIGSVCDESAFGNCTTGTLQPYGTACNDAKFCTTGDQCDFSGNCVGTQMDCSTSGGCATCSETTHQCDDPAPSGTFCSDGNNCTTGDQCNATGQCVGQPRDCSSYNSGNGCTVGYCDPTFGSCTTRYAALGTLCDDANPCTTSDACTSSGYCSGSSTTTNNAPCSDGNDCTTGDYCSFGSCTWMTYATAGTPCGGPCNIGQCSGSTSCSFINYATTGTSCDDKNPCTVGDQCSFGSCSGTTSTTATCSLPGCTSGAHCTSGGCSCN
jgi:hypothetical protein